PDELVAAPRGGAVAWVFNALGARNIWVAAPPDYRGKAVTSYAEDDGQELTDLRWAPDGRAIVYVRGGGPNGKGEYPNPHSLVTGVEQAVWLVAATGGTPRRLSEGHAPAVSPKGDRVAFVRHGQVWWTSLGDTSGQGEQLIHARGSARSLRVADLASGAGRQVWVADTGRGSVFREIVAQNQIVWGGADRLVFPWEKDGWTHLYAVPVSGGRATPLTPGAFEVEHVVVSPDGATVVFSSNQDDIERRHIWKVAVTGGAPA